MSTVLYRVHWEDCPPMSPEHAWSAPWGTIRSDDGSRYQCVVCDGTGEGFRDCPRCVCGVVEAADGDVVTCPLCKGNVVLDGCENCEGDGWWDCIRGYSCTASPEGLLDYFECSARSGLAGGETVVVFEGEVVDSGIDGEPTAVPVRIIETLSWADFVARTTAVTAR
ncbi:hypothetical protein ACWERV_23060 [Streptomyces sp. NPDC004031]